MPAIFGSEVFPSPVLEQIGREAGVEYVDELRDDDLPGEPGDAEHSWLGLMRFDYITMTEALGGDAVRARGVRRCATSPPTRPSTRNDAAPPGAELVRLDRVTCAYGGDAGAGRRRPRHHGRAVHRHRRAVRVGQDHAAAGPARHGAARRRVGRTAGDGLRVGYVPQVETVNWSFPVTVAECVLMARTRGPGPAVAQPGRARRGRRDPRPPRHRATWPAATSASCPAASSSGCSSPGPCSAGPTCCSWTSRRRASTSRTRHEVLHLLDDLHDDGLAIVLTTHDLNGIAAHLPHLVCLNTEVIGQGTPAPGAHRRRPRAHLRRPDGDPRARRACRSCSTSTRRPTTSSACARPGA